MCRCRSTIWVLVAPRLSHGGSACTAATHRGRPGTWQCCRGPGRTGSPTCDALERGVIQRPSERSRIGAPPRARSPYTRRVLVAAISPGRARWPRGGGPGHAAAVANPKDQGSSSSGTDPEDVVAPWWQIEVEPVRYQVASLTIVASRTHQV